MLYIKDRTMIEDDDLGFYESMIAEGEDIAELLYANTGNVGDIGELLQLAAQEIIRLRTLKVTDNEQRKRITTKNTRLFIP